jgi:hypothetical protein
MPDEWIPFLLRKIGVEEDSFLEAIIVIMISALMTGTLLWIFINDSGYLP